MFIRVRDVRLFFDVEGPQLACDGPRMREKPTLLLLHGGPDLDHSVLRPDFSALANVAQVIYLDQRGHGRSDRSTPDHWNLAEWADDVHGFCEALGIERPVVLGTSFGGYVAMVYALRHPGHAAKLVLISTALRGTGDPERRARVLDAFERLGGAEARAVALRVCDDRSPEAFREYRRVCGPLYTRRPPDPDAARRRPASHDVLHFFERPDGEGVTFNVRSELAGIRTPTLVIGGEDDPITPIAEQQEIADVLPAEMVRFERFAGCGHGVYRDNPEDFFKLIAEFLLQ